MQTEHSHILYFHRQTPQPKSPKKLTKGRRRTKGTAQRDRKTAPQTVSTKSPTLSLNFDAILNNSTVKKTAGPAATPITSTAMPETTTVVQQPNLEMFTQMFQVLTEKIMQPLANQLNQIGATVQEMKEKRKMMNLKNSRMKIKRRV